MKKLTFLFIPFICLGCEYLFEETPTKMDLLFTNGFKMTLEQVYIVDKYQPNNFKELFVDGTNTIDINEFTSYNDGVEKPNYQPMFLAISKDEIWSISSHFIERYNTTEEQWVGMNKYTYTTPHSVQYNIIDCENEYLKRKFTIGYNVDVPIMYFPSDYRGFRMICEPMNKSDNFASTNLMIVSHQVGQYIYFDTNDVVKLSYQLTKPLTANEVKIEIEKGNYTLYIYNNLTTYRIGDNLYIPRYNSYVYLASIAGNGNVVGYSNTHYRFKFKIIL